MNTTEKDYIAVGFNGEESKITPLIPMDGNVAASKVIRGVTGIRNIQLYCVEVSASSSRCIGNIPWDDDLTSDVQLHYLPEQGRGTVCIMAKNEVWEYTAKEPVVDKQRVRQLEQETEVKILWPDELANELKKEIFGQDDAIKAVSESIAANLRRKRPEVEVIVLFGPTGVGKTDTGNALPGALKKLTGREYGFQQIAMNQYTEAHSLHQWFGAPPSYVGYQDPTVFEPCRTNPYQVFLLDEVEKSTDRIWTGLMECFSNSYVKLADNSLPIDLSHAIFILTSNVPIDMKAYGEATPFQRKELCRDALTRTCGHPEVAGKIGTCLAFQELPGDAITDIVLKFAMQELQNNDMELAHMDEQLMVELKQMHRSSKYGARSVKDAVRTALTFTVYDRDLQRYRGKRVNLSGHAESIQITVIP